MGELKYVVGYSRKVQTVPYENVAISLQMDFRFDHDKDEAFKLVRDTVERWLDESLNSGERH